jgi:signal recognition particle receptor subunit beta
MPMQAGNVNGFKTTLQIFTVPGQVFYNQTRKLVLKGADGVVFVADSLAQCMVLNLESMDNLRANLLETENVELDDLPLVFQWNKRDLEDLSSVQALEEALNPRHLPSFESVAITGEGVFETIQEIVRLAVSNIRRNNGDDGEAPVLNLQPKPGGGILEGRQVPKPPEEV